MNSKLAQILEEAVLNACRNELARSQQNTKNASESIVVALNELDKLNKNKGMPKYNLPWVPLLHASWYHLAHVNFCLEILSSLIEKPVRSGESIGILDFGCGTMPLQWAVAVAVADMVKNSLPIPDIHIVNTDTSEGMSNLGCDMWRELHKAVKSSGESETRLLADVMQKIGEKPIVLNHSSNGCSESWPQDKTLHLVTVIHAVYMKVDVLHREYIEKITPHSQATLGVLFTTSKNNEELLKTEHIPREKSSKLAGCLSAKPLVDRRLARALTKFRREEILSLCGKSPAHIATNFLTGEVSWQPSNPVGILL